jgi:hypothetical protein
MHLDLPASGEGLWCSRAPHAQGLQRRHVPAGPCARPPGPRRGDLPGHRHPDHGGHTPDRVGRIDPPTAVVAVVDLDADLTLGPDQTDAEVCAQQPFFASAQAASRWLADHPQGRLIPVRSFHAEARRLVDRLERGADCTTAPHGRTGSAASTKTRRYRGPKPSSIQRPSNASATGTRRRATISNRGCHGSGRTSARHSARTSTRPASGPRTHTPRLNPRSRQPVTVAHASSRRDEGATPPASPDRRW